MPRAGTLAVQALQNGGRGRVVSVHRRALNLLFEDRTLVGILPASRSVHPWALATGTFPTDLTVDAPFTVGDRILEIGSHLLDLGDLEVVDLELHHYPGSLPEDLVTGLRAASGELTAPAPFESRLASASKAFRTQEDLSALIGVLGVGVGLTPSGDDLLVGVLAGLDLRREAAPATASLRRRLVRALLPELEGGTSRLSGQLLGAACTGLYAEPLLHLLRALASGEEEAVTQAVPPVLAQGHSSGRDTLRGLLLALDVPDRGARAHL